MFNLHSILKIIFFQGAEAEERRHTAILRIKMGCAKLLRFPSVLSGFSIKRSHLHKFQHVEVLTEFMGVTKMAVSC
jgi:hypothetical protein